MATTTTIMKWNKYKEEWREERKKKQQYKIVLFDYCALPMACLSWTLNMWTHIAIKANRGLCIHQCAYRYKQCHRKNKNNIKLKSFSERRIFGWIECWIHKPMWLQESVLFASTLSILYTVHTFEEQREEKKPNSDTKDQQNIHMNIMHIPWGDPCSVLRVWEYSH